MRNLRKWEEEYMQYKMGTRQKEMKEIQEKLDNKTANKEDYDKLMKMKKIESNIDKVTNILELKNKLYEQIKEIEAELAKREENKEVESKQSEQDKSIFDEAKALQEELEKIEAEKEEVKKELKEKAKNNTLTLEEKALLDQKLSELDSKLEENNSKYTKNAEALKNIKERKPESKPVMKTNKFSGISNEELDKKKFDLSSKISKCNMVAGNLMKGMNWDSIEIKLEKWQDKKYFPKDGKPLTEKPLLTLGTKDLEGVNQEKIEESEQESSETKELIKPNKIIKWMQENKEEHKWTYNFLNKFYNAEKYPRMYNLINKITNTKEQEPKIEKEEPKAEKIETLKERKDDFDKYLKEVAEKGLKTMQQEKLSKAREQAKAREEQKFNKVEEEKQEEEMEQE